MTEENSNTGQIKEDAAGTPQTIHIIHHNDLDGICAAAIVALAYYPRGAKIAYYATNYNRPADISRINTDDFVIIVDFSYPPEEMTRIENALDYDRDIRSGRRRIVWIDHHKTAERFGYHYPGLRDFVDKGRSGCELTWQFFFGSAIMPPAVSLIGDYDSWRLAIPESKQFYEGAKTFCLSPEAPLWAPLLDRNDEALQLVLAAGSITMTYRDQYCERIRHSYGYETEIAGHKAFAMNLFGFGSQSFGDKFAKYPLVIAYVHDGCNFTVSLYSEAVDVGEIAKSLGGGGHKGATGFVCAELPFKPVVYLDHC